ncbi:branched-chain amino acid ABC transporter permease [Brevibacillus brevis]|uniref:Branched-chain amino acid ABC transporter permease n=1 Tax=Brevibacillus brevis TaxID=1393 RepID=A0ABY9T5T9_BREBE|nr:branched-chain amino acid ABC transporter permease [Brevibacillus brevis]WNC15450.1 branched-chain amino acid ABC transporter permease [Brevibacillus brevis]
MYFDIFVSGLAVGCIYSLIAMSYSLIFRSSGVLNMGTGEFVMIGGLVGFSLISQVTENYYLVTLLTMAVAGLVGYLSNVLVFHPVQKRGGQAIHVLIASIGIMIILPQIGALIWGAEPLSFPGRLSAGQVELGSAKISGISFLIILLSFVIMVLFQLFFKFTRLGQAMRAIADDRVMSQLLGVNYRKYIALIFLVAGALTGVAGVLLGPLYYVSYDMGIIGIKAFAAAVLGGFGNIMGAVIGGILLGLIEAFGGTMISSEFRDLILYAILILVLLIRPAGLLGIKQRRDTA